MKQNNKTTEQASDAHITTDLNFEITWVDDAFKKLFGYEFEEIIGKQPDLLNAEPFSDEMQKEIYKTVAAGNAYLGEALNIKKDGSVFQCEFTVYPIFDKNRNIIAYSGHQRDITNSKQLEGKIKRFSKIFEESLNEIYLFNADNLKFTQVNMAAQNNLGYTMDELRKISPLHIKPKVTASSFAKILEPLYSCEKDEVVFETVHQRKDKSQYDVEVHLQLMQYENENLFAAIILDITERKQAEQKLRESEINLLEAQHIAKIGRWELNLVSNILNWSPEIFKIFEIDENKFGANYESFINAIHPDDRKKVDLAYSNSLKDKKPYNIEHRLLFGDDRIKWVNEICRTDYDQNGKAIRSIGVVQDITDRKQIDAKLKSLSVIVEQSTEAIARTDMKGNINYANNAWCVMHGYNDPNSLIGKNLKMFHNKEQMVNDVIPFNNIVKKKGTFSGEVGHINKDGKRFPTLMTSTLIKDEKGASIGIVGLAKDISDLKLMQRELWKSEKQFRLLADHTYDWEYWINPNGEYVYLSPSCERITGYTAEEFITNKKLLQEITKTEYADKVNSHFIDENNKDAPILSMEIPIITKNGEERWLMHNCSPILDDNGKYIGRRGTNRDITKRKLAEEDLEKRYNELLLFNEVTVDREIKMIELKKEINELLEKSGKKPKYEIPV